MSDNSQRDPVEVLAEEFVARHRRGERPALTEYTQRQPDRAEEIRELFPALVVMEQLKPAAGDLTAGFDGPKVVSVPLPDRLGDYRILREVGRGGMGVVYEAEQLSLGRHVALKVLPGHSLLNATYLERFRREARAAARLHHTNIVPVFGASEADGVHFYAMQFIHGEGLDKVLHDVRHLRYRSSDFAAVTKSASFGERSVAQSLLHGTFAGPEPLADATTLPATTPERPTSEAGSSITGLSSAGRSDTEYYRSVARIGLQAAEALAYAHKQSVLHRDVKPSNLLLDLQGTVWITDFGLAKAEGTDELTHAGDIVGTIRFMAPERFDGRSLPQSDIYSLGVTLYEMIALQPAFDASHRARLIEQVLHDPPKPLARIDRRVPRDLDTIIQKCLAKEPRDRYVSADALADDLRRFLADRPIKARRVTLTEQLWRWRRRNPLLAALAALVTFLLLVLAAGSTATALIYRRQVDQVKKAKADETGQLWQSLLAQARAGIASRRPGQRFDSLEAIEKAARIRPSIELRNAAIAAMALVDIRQVREWDNVATGGVSPQVISHSTATAFDSDFTHFATTDLAGNIRVCSVANQRVLATLRSGEGGLAEVLRFSPDGRYLAVSHGFPRGDCHVWDWRAGKLVVDHKRDFGIAVFDFHPDSQSIVFGGRFNGDLILYRLSDGQPIHSWKVPSGADLSVFEPKRGRYIAVAQVNSGDVLVLDAQTGKQLIRWKKPGTNLQRLAWQPDGPIIAAASDDFRTYTFDTGTRKPLVVLEGHQAQVKEIAFHPTGDVLASWSWDGEMKLWGPRSGRELLSLPEKLVIDFRGDGRQVALMDMAGRIGLWEMAVPAECRLLYGHEGTYHCGLGFRSDGRILASCIEDGVRLWNARQGREIAHLRIGHTFGVRFHNENQSLLTSGIGGLRRWPIHLADSGDLDSIGPPQFIDVPIQARLNRLNLAGDRLAVVDDFHQAISLDLRHPESLVLMRGHRRMDRVALSPDGRYAATGTWNADDVRVYDAATGQTLTVIPAPENSYAAFTPDGRTLLVIEDSRSRIYRSYRVGTWEPIRDSQSRDSFANRLPIAFSADHRLITLLYQRTNLRLVEFETGEHVATFSVPNPQLITSSEFSPDGRYLAVFTSKAVIQLWHLHAIRARLGAMGLDWDSATTPPMPADEATEPAALEVRGEFDRPPPRSPEVQQRFDEAARRADREVVEYEDKTLTRGLEASPNDAKLLDRRGRLRIQLGRIEDGIADLTRALKLQTDQPQLRQFLAYTCNNRAWALMIGPPAQRNPTAALKIAEQAAALWPNDRMILNTLGLAQLRNGKAKEAADTLQQSLAVGPDRFAAFDLYILSMCHAALGNLAKAKDHFNRAAKLHEEHRAKLNAAQQRELCELRVEAEGALNTDMAKERD